MTPEYCQSHLFFRMSILLVLFSGRDDCTWVNSKNPQKNRKRRSKQSGNTTSKGKIAGKLQMPLPEESCILL